MHHRGVQLIIEVAGHGRDLAAIRIAARRVRRRIRIGDVFRDRAHAGRLRAHARSRDHHRCCKIHVPFSYGVPMAVRIMSTALE
jgi:hypothetical protein